jgi:hypothetical protein
MRYVLIITGYKGCIYHIPAEKWEIRLFILFHTQRVDKKSTDVYNYL